VETLSTPERTVVPPGSHPGDIISQVLEALDAGIDLEVYFEAIVSGLTHAELIEIKNWDTTHGDKLFTAHIAVRQAGVTAAQVTEARQFASGTTTHYIGDYYYAVALGDTHQEILGAWATGVTSAQYVKLRVLGQDSKIIIELQTQGAPLDKIASLLSKGGTLSEYHQAIAAGFTTETYALLRCSAKFDHQSVMNHL